METIRVENAVLPTLTSRPLESRVVSDTTVGWSTTHLDKPSPAAAAVTGAPSAAKHALTTSPTVRRYLQQTELNETATSVCKQATVSGGSKGRGAIRPCPPSSQIVWT